MIKIFSCALVLLTHTSICPNKLFCPITPEKPNPNSIFSLIDTRTDHKANLSSTYLKANYFQHSGNYPKAIEAYNYLFELDAPSHVYDGYLRLLSQTNQYEKIAELINKEPELFKNKDDLDLQLIKVQSFLTTGQLKKAHENLQALKQKHPHKKRIIYLLTVFYDQTGNLNRAIEEIDTFVKQSPDFFLYFHKAQILLKHHKHEQALNAINKSLELRPGFGKGVLFKALLLEQTKKTTEAIESYKNFLLIAGTNEPVIKQLVRLLFSQKRFAEAAEQLQKLDSQNSSYHFDLALLWYKANKQEIALPHVRKAIEKQPQFSQARLLLSDLLFNLKKDDELLQTSQQWLEQSPNDNITIYKLLSFAKLRPEKITYKKIIELLIAVQTKHPNKENLALAIADLSLKTKQYKKALTAYAQVFSLTNNEQLKARIVFQKAFIYTRMNNNLEKALAELNSGKSLHAVYLPSLHLRAETLTKLNRLTQALEAIKETLAHKDKMSPSYNACVLETKATIYKKQHNYKLELETLEQAIKLAPQDKVIEEHLKDAKARQ